jgi:hypothetical protein
VSGGAVAGAILGALVALLWTVTTSPPAWVNVVAAFAVCGALLMLALQAFFEYKRRTYDPALIMTFDDRFNTPEMKSARAKAARILLEHRGRMRELGTELAYVDDVLDFFEDLGFYIEGHHLTPEVTHHTFYYWIRGYHSAASEYVAVSQEGEPAAWDHFDKLFRITHEIEVERSKNRATRSLDEEEIKRFLSFEAEDDSQC